MKLRQVKASDPDQNSAEPPHSELKGMNLMRRSFLKTGLSVGAFGAIGMTARKAVAGNSGADWVDWCPERMEGSTCVYHTWYAHALRGCARIFEILGDMPAKELCKKRMTRQQQVLAKHFWNGNAYWDNLNFQGEKVGRFWCDSQIWPSIELQLAGKRIQFPRTV